MYYIIILFYYYYILIQLTTLVTKTAERGDSGEYRLTVQNESGTDTHSAKVTVLGKTSTWLFCGDVAVKKYGACITHGLTCSDVLT